MCQDKEERVHKLLTCEEEEDKDHNHCVSKVEDGAGSSYYLQLWEEVVHSIDEQIDCCEAAGQEGAPPPVVVLDTHYKGRAVRI